MTPNPPDPLRSEPARGSTPPRNLGGPPPSAGASRPRTLDELVYRRLNWTMHRITLLSLAMQFLVLGAWFVGTGSGYVNPWAREPAAMSLIVPVTASMWYLARKGRLNRRLMYGYVFFFSTWPTALALGTQGVFPWGAASILVGPPALLWIFATVLSGITLERRLPLVTGFWAGAQQLVVYYVAQPSFAAIQDHDWLIEHLGTWHSVIGRSLTMVAIGAMVGFVAEFGRKVLAHSLEEERKVTLEAAARASAEAASSAKTAFLATMSHEIRTPLNAILGYAQALARRPGIDADTVAGLGIIEDSSQHLRTVVDDLLDLARVEADRLELDPTAVHLESVLHTVLDLLRRRASSKGLELALGLDPAAPEWVCVDSKRLRQVLLNLVGNAVKFTGTGHVKLRVSQVAAGVLFEVEDTGPGVEPAKRDTIFESFQQAEAGKREADGAGLGLAISQRLVALMGGALQLRTEYGEGSTFFFTLPLSAAPARALPTRLTSVTGYEGPRRRILVADDGRLNREVLEALLAPLGFDVLLVCDGREAVDTARARMPDIILMDLVMPALDGFEATRILRADARLRSIPIIATSASVMAIDTQDHSLFDAAIRKPLDINELLETIGTCLGLRWTAAEAPPAAADGVPTEGLPRRATLSRMSALARVGNLDAIAALCRELEREEPNPFTRRVRLLADSFEDEALLRVLAAALDQSEAEVGSAAPLG